MRPKRKHGDNVFLDEESTNEFFYIEGDAYRDDPVPAGYEEEVAMLRVLIADVPVRELPGTTNSLRIERIGRVWRWKNTAENSGVTFKLYIKPDCLLPETIPGYYF